MFLIDNLNVKMVQVPLFSGHKTDVLNDNLDLKSQLAAVVAETNNKILTTANFFKNFIWALKYSTPSAQNGTDHAEQKRI